MLGDVNNAGVICVRLLYNGIVSVGLERVLMIRRQSARFPPLSVACRARCRQAQASRADKGEQKKGQMERMTDSGDPELWWMNGAVLGNVHPASACAGRPCCLHNPSDHALRDAPLRWRNDRGICERVCEHGVAHDDPDDLAYRRSIGRQASGVHGCDGCCDVEPWCE